MLENSLFGVVKLIKNADLVTILIQDVVLDLMHVEVFRYLMLVGLVKM